MANSLAAAYPCAIFRMQFEEEKAFKLTFKEDNDFDMKMDKITVRYVDPTEEYTGPYEVTPSPETQTLATEQKTLIHDVTVSAIPSNYADTSDATIDASEVLSGEVAYGYDNVEQKAVKIVGTMPERGNLGTITLDKDTTSYVVPNGHISGGTVRIVTEEKSATPTKSTQTIQPTSGKVISGFTVNPIPSEYQDVSQVDASASDVLYGKKIVDSEGTVVEGTMAERGNLGTVTLDANTTSYSIPSGHVSGGTVQIVLEQKSATPTKSTQTINPTSGKVLSQLTVNPIPAAYQDDTEVDAVASDVLYGKKIVDSSGTVLEGSMPNRGAFVGTIDGLNTMSCAIPQGYHNGNGSVSLTNGIENELDEILNGASE